MIDFVGAGMRLSLRRGCRRPSAVPFGYRVGTHLRPMRTADGRAEVQDRLHALWHDKRLFRPLISTAHIAWAAGLLEGEGQAEIIKLLKVSKSTVYRHTRQLRRKRVMVRGTAMPYLLPMLPRIA